jgi:hypothetical protein
MTVTKSLSLFQRSMRLIQQSYRRFDEYCMRIAPGLPNPPEIEEELRKHTFRDLSEFTIADHRKNLRDAWIEYKASFDDPDEEELEKSKKIVKDAVFGMKDQVNKNTKANLEYLEKRLEGTTVLSNVKEMSSTASENVQFIRQELANSKDKIDTDAISKKLQQFHEEHRSKKDVATTLKNNVNELIDLGKMGRDTALKMEKKDMEDIKDNLQGWFADKLLVGQSVIMAFVEGYKSGKKLEMTRENSLLISYAKETAEAQKVVLKEQFDNFMEEQKKKAALERKTKKIKTVVSADESTSSCTSNFSKEQQNS